MRRLLYVTALLLAAVLRMSAQDIIRVEAPEVVAADEQFNVTFVIEGEKSPSDFSWSQGDSFQLVWGPQKGSSTSIQIINGKRSSSRQTTFTYILMPTGTGTFSLPEATAKVGGTKISSQPFSIQVVSDGASSSRQQSSGGGSGPDKSSSSSSGTSSAGTVSDDDIFLKLSVNRSQVVIGEPVTATLKLYQRVNIAGFENARFPSFNGFWSQETYAPTNIEFKRESFDDKIYNTAVLRTYTLIPQQTGTMTIEPAELVCLVNVRVGNGISNSIFDSFFQDEYRTVRKKVKSSPVSIKVNQLPSGQPASFGGGVGSFGISARLTSDEINAHDAASLIITVSGRGNVTLLEEPKVDFPPDFEVYDTKTTVSADKSNGAVSGSKSFEYPFIPRSPGEFTIGPVEYSYYDVNSGKYVTVSTQPVTIKVARGKVSESATVASGTPSGVERRDVKSLGNDIRFISTKRPAFKESGSFFAGSPLFFVILVLLLSGSALLWLALRKMAAMKADVAGSRNRKATKMALGRLKVADEYLGRNLYTAFYEELHKALLGFISDKLNMDMSEMSKENIISTLREGGVSESQAKSFTDLLDACEFARYSPDAGNQAMRAHFDSAVEAISGIDSSLKVDRKKTKGAGLAVGLFLLFGSSFMADAQSDSSVFSIVPEPADSAIAAVSEIDTEDVDALWDAGVQAYSDGRFSDAAQLWQGIVETGMTSPELYCNLGDAYFKEGNYPQAILYYERSLKLDPSYSDARYNLAFCENFVQDKIESVPEFILKSLARKICYLMGSNSWVTLFFVFLVIALAMFLLFLLGSTASRRRIGFFSGVVALVLSVSALSFSLWQKSDCLSADTAIVMSPVSSVNSSPSSTSSKDLFVIHEGTKVNIIDQVNGWYNISLADGRQGWVRKNDIEVI